MFVFALLAENEFIFRRILVGGVSCWTFSSAAAGAGLAMRDLHNSFSAAAAAGEMQMKAGDGDNKYGCYDSDLQGGGGVLKCIKREEL